jgi:hypothetical protein
MSEDELDEKIHIVFSLIEYSLEQVVELNRIH